MWIRYLIALVILLGCRNSAVGAMAETKMPGDSLVGRTLTLATGNERGIYYAFGHALSNAASMEGLNIQVLASQGSVDNLEQLIAGQVDLCLAQSDTALDCFQGKGHFNKPETNLIAIAPVYTEAVHILVRNRLQVKRIQEFSGKRVALGPLGSGTEIIALRLLGAAGISISEIIPVRLDLEASLRALGHDEVDIVFVTSGYPSEAVESVLKSGDAWLYEPNIDVCKRLVSEAPYLVISDIPCSTYSGQYEAVTTIGIRALLLGRSVSGEKLSYTMAKVVATCDHDKSGRFKLPKADSGWSMSTVVPLGLGAVRYYEESGLVRGLAVRKWFGYILSLLLFAGVIFGLARFREIRRRARNDGAAIALAAFSIIAVWVIGSYFLYLGEHKINDSYGTYSLSLWATLVNWMSFGTKEPYTFWGRITATIMLVLGAGGVFWFGKNLWEGLKRMRTRYSDHYVIINWNAKGPRLLKQLRDEDFIKKKDIVVILEVSTDDDNLFHDGDGVAYIKEGGVTEAAFEHACIKDAYSVIILASESKDAEVADAKTILAILAVRQLQGKDGRPLPIIAEIRNPQKVNLANYVGVLENGAVEVVSSDHFGADLLCQAAVTPGATHVYAQLLTFGKDSSEIYARVISQEWVDRSFVDICRCALATRGKKSSVIPVGIKRGDVMHINPLDSIISPLQQGDTIFAICDNVDALDLMMKDSFQGV